MALLQKPRRKKHQSCGAEQTGHSELKLAKIPHASLSPKREDYTVLFTCEGQLPMSLATSDAEEWSG